MNEAGEVPADNYVLTLDELSALTREGGKPAETLMNVVALIARRFQTDVCSAYLLEPDRANLVLAATLGLRRECIGTLRMALHEGLAGLVAEQVRPVAVEEVRKHPRFKYFREAGEDAYQSFLGVPLIDRGVLQGVLVVQTVEPRSFSDEEVRMLVRGRGAGGAGGERSAHARSLHRSHAGAAVVAGAQSVVELGPRFHQPVPRPGPGALAGAQSQSHLAAQRDPAGRRWNGAPAELVLHSRINYAYRRQQEYLQADRTWGATHAGVLRPRPVAYFSAEFGLHESVPIYSGGLGVLAGDHIKSASRSGHSADRHRTVLRPGLFPPAAGPQRLAAGGISSDRM